MALSKKKATTIALDPEADQLLDAVGKCPPLDQFHDEGARAVQLLEAIDSRDVRVIQSGEGSGFALEPGQPRPVVSEGFGQDLDRHVALQPAIPSPIHLAHAAGSDGGDDFVGTEASAGPQGQDERVKDCMPQSCPELRVIAEMRNDDAASGRPC